MAQAPSLADLVQDTSRKRGAKGKKPKPSVRSGGLVGERVPVRTDKQLRSVLKAAAKSRRREFAPRTPTGWDPRGTPEVEVRQPPPAAALDDWLEQQRGPTPWTPEAEGLTPSQARFLETVIQRLKVEMREDGVPQAPASEPMRHFLLGRPGTGKSFALLKLRELFETVMGYEAGVHFQFVAFQNAMANLIAGDTVHHALNIVMNYGGSKGRGRQKQSGGTPAQRAAQARCLECRWLIIDEVSMVSAQLLAQTDRRLRELVRALETRRWRPDGTERPFAGLNVIYAGDFWQLDPPQATSLAQIPDFVLPAARTGAVSGEAEHGLVGPCLGAGRGRPHGADRTPGAEADRRRLVCGGA